MNFISDFTIFTYVSCLLRLLQSLLDLTIVLALAYSSNENNHFSDISVIIV